MAEYMEGILSTVEGKTSSKGKPYYLIEVAGERATAWNKKTFPVLVELLGQRVSVEYTTSDDGEYRNVTHVEARGQTGHSPRVPEQPPQNTPQPPPNAQTPGAGHVNRIDLVGLSIVRQCCLKSACDLFSGTGAMADDVIKACRQFEAHVLDGMDAPLGMDRVPLSDVPDIPDDDVPF